MLSSHHHHHHHLCALLMGLCNITSDSHPASLLLTSAEGFGEKLNRVCILQTVFRFPLLRGICLEVLPERRKYVCSVTVIV